MDDLVVMEIRHAIGDLFEPVEKEEGGKVKVGSEDVVEGSIRTVLHHYAVTRVLTAHPPVWWWWW